MPTITGNSPSSTKPTTLKEYLNKRWAALDLEYKNFNAHYKEIAEKIKPRRGRFFTSDRNQGAKAYTKIINSVATQAYKKATAGLFAGAMSPARPWFSIEDEDPAMNELPNVKIWLEQTTAQLNSVFEASNLYNMAPPFLGETLLFGTGAMCHVDDVENIARFYTYTAGSYRIAQNERLEVDTLGREYEMSVAQMVREFKLENCSTQVKTNYDNGDYEKYYPVRHLIEPNPEQEEYRLGNQFMPYRSIKWEISQENPEKNHVLSQKGFNEFPAYVLRWEVAGEDTYGTDCPGMMALGDVNMLQSQEKEKGKGIAKMVSPPMTGPAQLKNVPVSSLPGGLTLADSTADREGLRPIYKVEPRVQELTIDMERVERRINEAFMVDLFLAITNMQGIQPRNERELIERNEERLLQIGPTLTRIHIEFLAKLIERTFNQLARADLLPPPPPELAGRNLKVKFISSLAVAQRSVSIGGLERVAQFAGGLMGMGIEEAKEKVDWSQMMDEYAKVVGSPARIIVPDEVLEQRRAQRAQMERLAQAAEVADTAAGAAQKASNAQVGENNLLENVAAAARQSQGQQ